MWPSGCGHRDTLVYSTGNEEQAGSTQLGPPREPFGGHGWPEGVVNAAKRSAVSIGQLRRSPVLHLRPIDLVVYQEPSLSRDT